MEGDGNVWLRYRSRRLAIHHLELGPTAIHKSPDLPGLTERWRTNFFLNSLFSSTKSASNQTISANSMTTGLRQDFLFTPHDFVFGLAQLDHIETQDLYLRQTYGGGFGRDIIHRSRTQFSLLGEARS